MKQLIDIADFSSVDALLDLADELKKYPLKYKALGEGKVLGLLFFNSSLRTRFSTQRAAINLGMQTIAMNFGAEGWSLEYQDGTIMDQGSAEHIKEAAAVLSQYCDIIGIRSFPKLINKEEDESEQVLRGFARYATVPILSLEGATSHPLQALADALTIRTFSKVQRPKVVLSWAPHPRALPHAVPHSFVQMMKLLPVDLVITHPPGYELNSTITSGVPVFHDQEKALEGAHFVYIKNWSNYLDYGKILNTSTEWMMTAEKMKLTQNGYFMHCLPVRRNVVVEDAILDGDRSLTTVQATNRLYTAQAVLKCMLDEAQET